MTMVSSASGGEQRPNTVPCGRTRPHLPHDENSDSHYPCPGVPSTPAALSPQREAEIRELVEATTPGPWRLDADYAEVKSPEETLADVWEPTSESRNGEFIAAAPTAVRDLLAELERVRAERDAFADRVDTLTAVAKGNKRHVQEMYLAVQKANAVAAALRTRVAELERERHTTNDQLAERDVALRAAEKANDELFRQVDFWREGYRIVKGLTDDEVNALAVIDEATAPHPLPCRWPSSPSCNCAGGA